MLAAAAPQTLAAQRDSARSMTLEPVTVRAAADTATEPPLASTAFLLERAMKGRAGVGLDEVLALVPGLVAQNRYNLSLDTRLVSRGFGARSAFGVRGLTILLDGVPQTLPDGQSQLTNVDLNAVAEVAVMRGAGAAYYGNAAGGLVSLRSHSLVAARPSSSARVVGGSFGLFKASASGTAPVAGGGVGFTVSSLQWDGYRAHSAARLRQGSLSLEVPLSGSVRGAVRVRLADQPRSENPGALTDSLRDLDPSAAHPRNLAQNAGKAVRQTQASIEVASRGLRGEAAAVVYGLWRDLDNPLATGTGGWVLLDRGGLGARLSARLPLGAESRAELLAGLDLQRQDDERRNYDNLGGTRGDTLRVNQRETVDAAGARAALSLRVSARSAALIGLRYDHTRFRVSDRLRSDGDDSGERSMGALSFSAGLSRAVGRGTTLYANLSSAFETPTTTELADPGSGGLNRSLQPQRAVQGEAGVRHSAAAHSVSAAAFTAAIRDGLLPYEVPTSPGRFRYRNTGRSRHQGFELDAALRAAARVELRGALSLSRHRLVSFVTDSDTLDGNTLPGAPGWAGALELTVHPARTVTAAVEWRGAGRTWADDANTLSEDPWSTVDARLSWRSGRLGAFLGVNNLLDARYAGAVTVNGFAGRVFEPAPGRNWYAGLTAGAGR
jgi:iron complex outermembrane receptor protein